MAGRWLPLQYDALITWMINWVAKLDAHKTTLSIATGDITSATNDLAALQYIQSQSEAYKTKSQEINDYKLNLVKGPGPIGAFPGGLTSPDMPTAVAANIIDRISRLAAQLKAHDNYTTSIGEDLGIEPPTSTGLPDDAAPTGKAEARPNSEVRITFTKGNFDGVLIESQRDAETVWTVLGTDRFSPYTDTRPPVTAGRSEVRRYRLRFLSGDEPTGDYSDILTVATTP